MELGQYDPAKGWRLCGGAGSTQKNRRGSFFREANAGAVLLNTRNLGSRAATFRRADCERRTTKCERVAVGSTTMIYGNAISEDLITFRIELQEQREPYQSLLKLNVWRPLCDVIVDWSTILLAVTAVVLVSWWLAPMAVLVIANRQRALGNILHDAGHRNLHRAGMINDSIAHLLVAPLVFASLASYRDAHFKHHLHLGDRERDPDYLPSPEHRVVGWMENYARNVFSAPAWWGSLVGHLGSGDIRAISRLYIVGWWLVMGWLMAVLAGADFLAAFALLWMAARATIFHLITMFREMCDHFGLQSGGVVSFTRDIVRHGVWYDLVHPRNNGYHLTHHLLPAVPYYRLPEAQRMFSRTPLYRARGQAFSSYAFGAESVVAGWRTGAGV